MELQLDFYKVKAFWEGHKDSELSSNFDIMLVLRSTQMLELLEKNRNLDTLCSANARERHLKFMHATDILQHLTLD